MFSPTGDSERAPTDRNSATMWQINYHSSSKRNNMITVVMWLLVGMTPDNNYATPKTLAKFSENEQCQQEMEKLTADVRNRFLEFYCVPEITIPK